MGSALLNLGLPSFKLTSGSTTPVLQSRWMYNFRGVTQPFLKWLNLFTVSPKALKSKFVFFPFLPTLGVFGPPHFCDVIAVSSDLK